VALAWLKAGDRREARQAFEDCLRLDPQYTPALTDLGGLEIQEGKPQEGLALLEKALSLDPENPSALTNLAGAHLLLGQNAEAEVACRKALSLRPDSPDALTTLGRWPPSGADGTRPSSSRSGRLSSRLVTSTSRGT